jgi:hypothetical protein
MVDGSSIQSSVSLNVIVFLDVMYILLRILFSNLFFLFISCVVYAVGYLENIVLLVTHQLRPLSLDQIDNIFDHTFNVI